MADLVQHSPPGDVAAFVPRIRDAVTADPGFLERIAKALVTEACRQLRAHSTDM